MDSKILGFLLTYGLSNLFYVQVAEADSGYIKFDPARNEVIVFVHGVTGDAHETWTNADTDAYWPELIRSDQRLLSTNVWVFDYHSPKLSGAQDVEELALKLGDSLSTVFKKHEKVYFIAHSMGGLIVRQMLVLKSVPSAKVPLIFFFGTPSAGADLAGIAAAISKNPQFENLRPFARESDVARFARSWLSTSEDPNRQYPQRIWSYCAYEIKGLVGNRIIVPMISASHLCSTAPRASLANHSTMVKPESTSSEPYKYFMSAYEFTRTNIATILASNGAITVHDQNNPGLDTSRLKLKYARVGGDTFRVGCDETRAGTVPVNLEITNSEHLVAAITLHKETQGLESGSFEPRVSESGRLTIDYEITGLRSGLFRKCPQIGTADLGIQYVVTDTQ